MASEVLTNEEILEDISGADANVVSEHTSKIVVKPEDKFYSDAVNYWSEIPPTVDGMLGGFGHISQTDIQGSRQFLRQLFQTKHPPGKGQALDCGAGIGRITRHLLVNFFEKVDLVEQNPIFLKKAKQYLGEKLSSKIGEYYPVGLQNFIPEENKYDIIWTQWVLGHLTDKHLVTFLKNAKKGLKENGLIIIKENIASDNIEVDEKDSSITRPYSHYQDIFEKAGLDCYKKMKQAHFPKFLFTVYMFALKPKEGSG